jgi:autoinducer 2-binding protein LuxP
LNSDLKVIHEYYTDFNKEKAIKATLDLLKRGSNIKFIYACSTDIALGVIEVLKEKNLLGKIKVNGWGGGNSELSAIEKGLLDITGLKKQVPTIYSGEFKIVKKGIRKEELEEYKKRAFRYTLND